MKLQFASYFLGTLNRKIQRAPLFRGSQIIGEKVLPIFSIWCAKLGHRPTQEYQQEINKARWKIIQTFSVIFHLALSISCWYSCIMRCMTIMAHWQWATMGARGSFARSECEEEFASSSRMGNFGYAPYYGLVDQRLAARSTGSTRATRLVS